MPNYVTNILTVKGPADEIKRFKELAFREEDGENGFDFEKIYPMPPSLRITSGGHDSEAIVAYLTNNCETEVSPFVKETAERCGCTNMFDKEYVMTSYERAKKMIQENGKDKKYSFSSNGDDTDQMTLYEAGKVYVNNILEYGCSTWYEWSIKNWGTKWNAMDAVVTDQCKTSITIEYLTAWSTADGVIIKLGQLFPALTFTCQYADEDFGSNTGEYEVHGETFIETVSFEGYCKESQEFAAKVLDYNLGADGDYVYDEEEGLYVWNDDCE